jgi:hypothetical protein
VVLVAEIAASSGQPYEFFYITVNYPWLKFVGFLGGVDGDVPDLLRLHFSPRLGRC